MLKKQHASIILSALNEHYTLCVAIKYNSLIALIALIGLIQKQSKARRFLGFSLRGNSI